jgi:hypothetical protein
MNAACAKKQKGKRVAESAAREFVDGRGADGENV